jgi:hypothetical protein
VAPEGLGWFLAHVPIDPRLATGFQAICVFSALAAILGIRARLALAILTFATFYLFALSQLSGAVWHDMHLLWMSALLAASPCDEALAYDTKGTSLPVASPRFGLPLTFARLLLGAVYFFPGIYKLSTSGLAWALSDNLRNQLWWKWAEHATIPTVRLDHAPFLLHASGLFVIAFELSFPVLALLPRARPWAAGIGVLFHLLAAYFFRIPFLSLWFLYVVLVDPCPYVARLRRAIGKARWAPARDEAEPAGEPATPPSTPSPSPRSKDRATVIVGVALVLGACIQGARGQMRSFPFACYPTFQWILGTEMPDLEVEAVLEDGTEVALPRGRRPGDYRSQRQWGEVFGLVGMWGPVDPRRLRAYLGELERDRPTRSLVDTAELVRVYRSEVSVDPDDRGQPPVRRTLLVEIARAMP